MSKSELKYFEVLNAKKDEATVLISGGIFEWGDNSSKQIRAKAQLLDSKYKKIKFILNTKGGDVAEGVDIYYAIKDMKAETTGVVVGVAASIGFVILQAFDHRGMKKMTRAMSHKFSSTASGSAKKMREKAELMESWESDIVSEITERTKKEKETVQSWFAEGEDVWFTPQQMLDNNLIDFIDDGKAESVPKNIVNDADLLYSHYQTAILNQYEKQTAIENKHKNKMKKEHLELIGLSEGASDAAIENKLKELSENGATLEKSQAIIKSNATSRVESLIKDGKLEEKQKEFAINMMMNQPEEAEAFFNSLNAAVKPTDVINHGGNGRKRNEDRQSWTLNNWLEKDPEGLDNLSDEEYEEIKKEAYNQK